MIILEEGNYSEKRLLVLVTTAGAGLKQRNAINGGSYIERASMSTWLSTRPTKITEGKTT
jgi:hypothetical protein